MTAVPRVLVLTEFYPRAGAMHEGLFVQEQIRHLSGVEVAGVISPAVQYLPLPRYRALRQPPEPPEWQEAPCAPVFRPVLYHLPLVAELYAGALLFRQARKAVRARQLQFDLIHAHWAFRSGYVASRLAAARGVPFILTVQGSDVHRWMHERRKQRQSLHALRRARLVIALNHTMRDRVVAAGVPADAVVVMPQGVDTARFAPAPSSRRSEMRAQLGEAFYFVCAANHYTVKGIDILLQALSMTPPPAAVVLVGAGPESTALQKLAHQLGVARRVFFAGRQPPESMPDWLNAADAVVIPSREEGGPAVLLEALACGKPVVATSTGLAPEILHDGVAGLVVPVADPAALARAMAHMRNRTWSPPLLRARAMACDWRALGQRLAALYRQVLQQ